MENGKLKAALLVVTLGLAACGSNKNIDMATLTDDAKYVSTQGLSSYGEFAEVDDWGRTVQDRLAMKKFYFDF